MLQGEQAHRIDVARDARRHLADGDQRRLVEDWRRPASDDLQVVVDVAETLVLGEAVQVVAIQHPAHQGSGMGVAELLEQPLLAAHDDGDDVRLGKVALAYEV